MTPKFKLIKADEDPDFMNEHDVIGGSLEEIDIEMQEILDDYINSFLKLDIAKFFYENQSAMDTPANIAKYIGRGEYDVAPALESLAQNGILMARTLSSGINVYSYQPSRKMKRLLERFMQMNSSQEGRFLTVTHLLKTKHHPREK